MISKEQIFYDDMERIVDPYMYDGGHCEFCLIGQMRVMLNAGDVDEVAELYDIDRDVVSEIFCAVAEDQYNHNLTGALEYVRHRLGL